MEATQIVAQIIAVEWTEKSRGGPAATHRAKVPAGFRLPDGISAPFTQRITCTERNAFQPTIRNHARLATALNEIGVVLTIENDVVKIAADRNKRPSAPPARRLQPGQWIRWKDSSSGRRFARTITINLASIQRPPSNLFLGTPTFEAETILTW